MFRSSTNSGSLSPVAQGAAGGEAGNYVGAALVARCCAVGGGAAAPLPPSGERPPAPWVQLLRGAPPGWRWTAAASPLPWPSCLSAACPGRVHGPPSACWKGAPGPGSPRAALRWRTGSIFPRPSPRAAFWTDCRRACWARASRQACPGEAMEELAARCQAEADDALGRLLSK